MTRTELIGRRRFLQASGAFGALFAASPAVAQSPRRTILEMARAAEKLTGVDVIDVHAHLDNTPPNRIWPQNAEDLLQDMDRCGIGCAVFSHLGGLFALTPQALQAANDRSAEAARKYPRRLRSYMVFHPHLLETSKQQMQRILEPGSPFVGLKLHGAFHQYPANGPQYQPAFQFAHDHGLPVLFHVAGISEDYSSSIGRLVDQYSGMNLILAHLGPKEELLPPLMKGRSNVFVDTCLSTGRHRQIERIVRRIGVEKVLFATDAAFNSCVAGFAKVAFADLPEDEKRLVFGGNARRLFRNLLPS